MAELNDATPEVIRLDPRVSGVGPQARLPLAKSQHNVETRVDEMNTMGVSHHAVSMPPFLFCSTADDDDFVTEVVARGNDELAGYVAGAPDRLVALGSVPLGWPTAADEARRCVDELGMAGIAIGSQGAGKDLDDPVNTDLWAMLAERQIFVFLHPSGVPDPPRLRQFYLEQLVGYPMETLVAVARLVFALVLERFNLTLCLAHGGGCVPLPPTHYLNCLYYDTMVFSTPILSRLVEDVGVGHVLLGTDHPFELGERAPVQAVAALGLPEKDTRAILWDTAAALLNLG